MWYLLLENVTGPPTLHSADQKWALVPSKILFIASEPRFVWKLNFLDKVNPHNLKLLTKLKTFLWFFRVS